MIGDVFVCSFTFFSVFGKVIFFRKSSPKIRKDYMACQVILLASSQPSKMIQHDFLMVFLPFFKWFSYDFLMFFQ